MTGIIAAMDFEFLLLASAVLGASALQAATGIGFGVIAGPVLLIAMNDAAGIQVSVVLNLLIALLLAPAIYRLADRQVLNNLALGVLLGSPLGLLVYMNLDIAALKGLAGPSRTLFAGYAVAPRRARRVVARSADRTA